MEIGKQPRKMRDFAQPPPRAAYAPNTSSCWVARTSCAVAQSLVASRKVSLRAPFISVNGIKSLISLRRRATRAIEMAVHADDRKWAFLRTERLIQHVRALRAQPNHLPPGDTMDALCGACLGIRPPCQLRAQAMRQQPVPPPARIPRNRRPELSKHAVLRKALESVANILIAGGMG